MRKGRVPGNGAALMLLLIVAFLIAALPTIDDAYGNVRGPRAVEYPFTDMWDQNDSAFVNVEEDANDNLQINVTTERGFYTTKAVSDPGGDITFDSLDANSTLRKQQIQIAVQSSDDNFTSVKEIRRFNLSGGFQSFGLLSMAEAERARLNITFFPATSNEAQKTDLHSTTLHLIVSAETLKDVFPIRDFMFTFLLLMSLLTVWGIIRSATTG